MYLFNNNFQSPEIFGNRLNMRYMSNNNQIPLNIRRYPNQTFFNNNTGIIGYYNSYNILNQQYTDKLNQYNQFQQIMLARQQIYEYNLQMQYQLQLQQMNQSLVNNTNNLIYIDNQAIESVPLNTESIFQENYEQPLEIIILQNYDNTVTIKNVSHTELSITNNEEASKSEIEVEIKNGDKNVELETIRNELLNEEKINIGTCEAREIEVNVYENSLQNNEINQSNTNLFKNIQENEINSKNEEIHDELILINDMDQSEIKNNKHNGEIEIEEDTLLIIKYKNEKLGYNMLDLMEKNIDNCVIDGNSYYYENMVRSLNSTDFSEYLYTNHLNIDLINDININNNNNIDNNNNRINNLNNNNNIDSDLNNNNGINNMHADNNHLNNNNETIQNNNVEKLQVDELYTQEIKNDEYFHDKIKYKNLSNSNTKIEKETIDEINDKIQRFNLLLEKINKMEQMNILFKEAVLNEKKKSNQRLNIEKNQIYNIDKNDQINESDDYISECSILDTVKDIYDSNSQISYNENDIKSNSSKSCSDDESLTESNGEHVENYIKAINDYFEKEGFVGKCESKLNTYRWERNFQNAMSSLNDHIKEVNLDLENEQEYGNDQEKQKVYQPSYLLNQSNTQFQQQNELQTHLEQNKSQLDQKQQETQLNLQKESQSSQKQKKYQTNQQIEFQLNQKEKEFKSNQKQEYQFNQQKFKLIDKNSINNYNSSFINKNHTKNNNSSQIKFNNHLNKKNYHENFKESNETDNDILARLSQCRVINSKTIKQLSNNNNLNITKDKNNFDNKFISNKNINYFNDKNIIHSNEQYFPIQIKEPNLGFRSLINNGIKVNISDLMKPRVIKK